MVTPVDLAYEKFGDGRAVVILHGLFGSKRNWRSHAQRLAIHYTVFTVDLRNHGESPHDDDMSYTAMAADIGHLLDHLALDDVDLVGHSMGGKAAMTFALGGTARLRRLSVVDIAPVAYANEYGAMLAGLRQLDGTAIARRAAADEALGAAIPDREIRQFILQNLQLRNGSASWRFNLSALERHIDALVGAIPAAPGATFDRPVHCLRGARSDRVDDAGMRAMAAYFPDLSVLTIPAAGHWPHAENPADFGEALSSILATP